MNKDKNKKHVDTDNSMVVTRVERGKGGQIHGDRSRLDFEW